MAIFDNNWISYAMYVCGTVETSCDYGSIEISARMGIGIMQWTNDRSWELLNLMATDYPDTESMFPLLWGQIAPGTSNWGYRAFSQEEGNEISAALVTEQGVATQNKLWNIDVQNRYLPILRDNCQFTDPKTAIFALTNYHQYPDGMWAVLDAVGNCDVDRWYMGVMNNTVYATYANRQNTVKALLDEWDGESGKEGFGTTDPTVNEGGNKDPENGNPDGNFATTITKLKFNALEKYGNTFVLHMNINDSPANLSFVQGNNKYLWYPQKTKNNVETNTETEPIPPTENPGTGTDDIRKQIADTMISLAGKLIYTMEPAYRMDIPGGYGDCSSTVYWVYMHVTGLNIGTWTGDQCKSGDLVMEGSGPADTSTWLPGDLLLCNFYGYNPSYDHVEMYVGNNQLYGHNGPGMGPYIKEDASAYAAICSDWMLRRYV